MRVTGGIAKGRRLKGSRGSVLRPTSDLVREATFQLLQNKMEYPWEEVKVLDLFAGTGSLGIEALSRGANKGIFIDRARNSAELVKTNLSLTGFSQKSKIIILDLSKDLNRLPRMLGQRFELILADPPYSKGLAKKIVEFMPDADILAPGGYLVIEEKKDTPLPNEVLGSDGTRKLFLRDQRRYGHTAIWFYQCGSAT